MTASTGFARVQALRRIFAVGGCIGTVLVVAGIAAIAADASLAGIGGGAIGGGLVLIAGWVGARRGYRRYALGAELGGTVIPTVPRPHRLAWTTAAIALILAAFLVVGGIVGIVNGFTSTATAEGTITSVGKDCHGTYRDRFGTPHAFTHYGDLSYCAHEFYVGELVTVHYDPDNPRVADTDSPTHNVAMHVLLVVLGALLASPFLLLAAQKWLGLQLGRRPRT